jgi:hypothetical protein
MQVEKVSFTSSQNNQKQSALYSKDSFIKMGAISDFFVGTALAFGVMESYDKFHLLKNQDNILKSALPKIAKKHTVKNAFTAVLFGALYTAIDVAITTKLLPKLEKTYDKLEDMQKSQK